jgi:hypothetical protein
MKTAAEVKAAAEMKTAAEMTIIFRSLKRDPMGHCFSSLGADGVLRIWHSDSFELLDAARLSPAQIKDYLDRLPFDQAKEDKFRGVDGRGVSDEDMFNPPEGIRIKRPSEEFYQEYHRLVEERKRRRLAEEQERERKGVKKDSNAVSSCGLKRSNYNLDPI